MVATLANFASILKEFYLGPVQEQLNNEVLVLQIMEKATVDWNGRLCHIPSTLVALLAQPGTSLSLLLFPLPRSRTTATMWSTLGSCTVASR